MKLFKNLYDYRELLKTNVKKDIRGKYKGSFLGVLWSFLNPLLMVAVYAIVFPYIMRIKTDNYLQYLICGVIPWNFFTTVMGLGMGSIKNNAGVIKKVYFPREILPITYILSALCNTIFSYSIVFPMLLLFKIPITINILWLPIILIVQAIFNLGLAFIVSSVNVFFRDLEYLISVGIIALYFMTPVMYNIRILPLKYQHLLLLLNPMAGFITMYRDVTYYGTMPKIKLLLYLFTISILIFIIGYVTFQKLQKKFAEIL